MASTSACKKEAGFLRPGHYHLLFDNNRGDTVPIFSDLQSHARRYEKLKGVFADFHASVLSLPQVGGPPPEMAALVVGELVSGTHFDLSMAGTTVRVGFSYLPGQHGIHGVITGHVLDPLTRVPLDAFTTLTFTGHSETSMHHKNGKVMMLSDDGGAFWVAATLMSDGLHRPAASTGY